MTSAKQRISISRVTNILKEWDKGSQKIRMKILKSFVAQNQNKTGPELEQEFAQAASLFLIRLTAWLQLTMYIGLKDVKMMHMLFRVPVKVNGQCVAHLLQALSIFLSAPSGHKFMAEFLEVGGVLTLLEIVSVGHRQDRNRDKTAALVCLQHIANAGRKYKELICESYGVRAVAECLVKARTIHIQDACRNLLLLLSQGNPKFQGHVYKSLIALLPSPSPQAQQVAAQILRIMQPIVGQANPSIVEPALNLLRSSYVEVQYEATELIRLLMNYNVRGSLLTGLVALLRPGLHIVTSPDEDMPSLDVPANASPTVEIFRQQAAAARIIGVLAAESQKLADRLIQMRVIHHLLFCMGNKKYANSQRQASISLEFFCRKYSIIDDYVQEAMGRKLYEMFKANPEAMYVKMDDVQANVLISNKVNIPKIFDERTI